MRAGFLRNCQFFVRSDDVDRDARGRRRNRAFGPDTVRVRRSVKFDSQPLKPFEDSRTKRRAVFSGTTSQHDRIGATKRHEVRADVFAHAMSKDGKGEFGALASRGRLLE